MNDGTDRSDAADSGDFDVSDATVVEDFTGEVAKQLARGICAVAIGLGRFGNSIGDLAPDIDGDGDPGKLAARLKTAHAHGQNAARALRDALEHVGAANELLGKAATRARAAAHSASR